MQKEAGPFQSACQIAQAEGILDLSRATDAASKMRLPSSIQYSEPHLEASFARAPRRRAISPLPAIASANTSQWLERVINIALQQSASFLPTQASDGVQIFTVRIIRLLATPMLTYTSSPQSPAVAPSRYTLTPAC